MKVKYDHKLLIAIGRSRKASQWQNKEMLWSEFLDKLATTTRTRETVAEYAAMPKGERDTIKDVGGFVGGYLKNGRRNNASVVNRCMLCLDADNADPGLMDDLDMTFINAYALYSTHSHTPEKMRLRLIIPLTRTVTPDEYAAVSRRVADVLLKIRRMTAVAAKAAVGDGDRQADFRGHLLHRYGTFHIFKRRVSHLPPRSGNSSRRRCARRPLS